MILLIKVTYCEQVIIMKLGDIIIKYREDHGMSQRQFAKTCGLSNGFIAMLEKGANPKTGQPLVPAFETMNKLAAGMNITLGQLLCRIGDVKDMGEEFSVSVPVREGSLEYELRQVTENMTDEQKQKVLEYAMFIRHRDKQ